MKFGKQISAESKNDWGVHYLAYGKLKKALKGKAGDPATFQDRLHKEVGKVSCFVEKQARSLTKRWAELPAAAGEVREQSTRRLYALLQRFQAFVLVNCMAVVKIVKKYNKHHLEERPLDSLAILRSYPFFCGPGSPQWTPSAKPTVPVAAPVLAAEGVDPALTTLCCTAFVDLILTAYLGSHSTPRFGETDRRNPDGPSKDSRAGKGLAAADWLPQLLQDPHFADAEDGPAPQSDCATGLGVATPPEPRDPSSADAAAEPSHAAAVPAAPDMTTSEAADPPPADGHNAECEQIPMVGDPTRAMGRQSPVAADTIDPPVVREEPPPAAHPTLPAAAFGVARLVEREVSEPASRDTSVGSSPPSGPLASPLTPQLSLEPSSEPDSPTSSSSSSSPPPPAVPVVRTYPQAVPAPTSPAMHATVLTYCASNPRWVGARRSGPRGTEMLGAFLQAHRHVSVLALQECCVAAAVAEQALPDHSGVSHGGLALFWRRAQFQLMEAAHSPGPSGLLWARLKWVGGRRLESVLVVTGKATGAEDVPAIQDGLRRLLAAQPPREPLVLCGHFPQAVAAEVGAAHSLEDCFSQRGRPVPVTTLEGDPGAWAWVLSRGTVAVQRIQLVDFVYQGYSPSSQMALYTDYLALPTRRSDSTEASAAPAAGSTTTTSADLRPPKRGSMHVPYGANGRPV
eukprot:EG_transcript_1364